MPASLASYLQTSVVEKQLEPLFVADKLNLQSLVSLANLSVELCRDEQPQTEMPSEVVISESLDSQIEQLNQLRISIDTQISVLQSQLMS